jgi:hypothetical protein
MNTKGSINLFVYCRTDYFSFFYQLIRVRFGFVRARDSAKWARHQQQHGSAAAAKQSKKGNKKKAAAHKSILKLLRELPDDIKREWATANELLPTPSKKVQSQLDQ